MIWLLLVTTAVIAVKLWQAWQRQERRARLEQAYNGQGLPSPRSIPQRQRPFRPQSASERTLVKRLGHEATQRLLANAALKYPEKSRQWCADKALFDFERDRHV